MEPPRPRPPDSYRVAEWRVIVSRSSILGRSRQLGASSCTQTPHPARHGWLLAARLSRTAQRCGPSAEKQLRRILVGRALASRGPLQDGQPRLSSIWRQRGRTGTGVLAATMGTAHGTWIRAPSHAHDGIAAATRGKGRSAHADIERAPRPVACPAR